MSTAFRTTWHPLYLSDHFWTFLSIRIHFSMAVCCLHTKLTKTCVFQHTLTHSAYKILKDTSLLCFGGKWKTHWQVHYSIASRTLTEGTSYNQGQTTTIQCTRPPSLSSLPITITLQRRKSRNSLKCPRIIRPASDSASKYRVIMSTRQGWIRAHRPRPSIKGLRW